MMARSESISALVAALAKAQGAMSAAAKSNTNPHFKSKYADLASVWDAIREPLSRNELAVLQPVTTDGATVTITTILAHASGEFISEVLTLTAAQPTAQGVGSAITYGRRYGLSSMLGVAADEDDDGNAASGNARNVPEANQGRQNAAAPQGFAASWSALEAAAGKGLDALRDVWKATPEPVRVFVQAVKGSAFEDLKTRASAVAAPAATEAA